MHCTKTLPPKLAEALKSAFEIVNYVKGYALNHCIFMQLCEQINSQFKVFLYHSKVLLAISGKNDCVFELRRKLSTFLKNQNLRYFNSSRSQVFLYLANIFDALNHLNCQMQGDGSI